MQTRRILIVDDAPEFAHLVKDALATMQIPLQVTVYLSGEEAWLEALKTRFDLVITDLRLPGISGTELIRRVRQRFPKIKIIAVSGLAEAGLNERTRAAGVDVFYRKPVEIPLLLTKIDNLLAEIDQDNRPDEQPQKAPILSQMMTVPLTPKPEMMEEAPRESPKRINKPSPEDLASMRDLEQRLLNLLKESGAGGVALTTLSGMVLFKHGSADDFAFTSELVNTCSNLVDSIKQISSQPEDSISLGMLALNGNTTDLFVTLSGKFLVWLLFPTGSQSAEASKTAAAIYSSRDSLQYILNMLALLPLPTPPHPPEGKDASKKESIAAKEDDNLAVTRKLSEKQLNKKDVDAFWDAESAEDHETSISSDTISFDKAAKMGLVKDEPKNQKS